MKRGFKYLLLLLVLVFPFSMFADELVIEETHDDYSYYNALLFYNFTVNNNGWSTIDITYNNKVLSYNDAHIYCGENREFCPEEKVTVSNSDKLSIIKNSDLETPIVIEIMFEGIEVGESETKVSVDGVEYKFAEPIKTIVNEENNPPVQPEDIPDEKEEKDTEKCDVNTTKSNINIVLLIGLIVVSLLFVGAVVYIILMKNKKGNNNNNNSNNNKTDCKVTEVPVVNEKVETKIEEIKEEPVIEKIEEPVEVVNDNIPTDTITQENQNPSNENKEENKIQVEEGVEVETLD